ncbi:MAG: methionyl-tRNA formyltransferase [Candidatus Paceibacterota bacterium]|jgi:methionyl-tRNA formyltransferase
MNTQNNFVFFGTPKVASETLAALLAHGFTPALVVTSPDAPRGRGLVLTPSPTKVLALGKNIPVMTPEKLDGATIAAIAAYGCDYGICVAYGKIFPEELIATFPKGVLNVHYSLLPKYRGATPLETALLMGETETGVTIQKMVQGLDAGDVLAQEATPIAPGETARELRPRLIQMGAELLTTTLPKYVRGEIVPVPQDPARATRARKLRKEDGLLEMGAPALENWHKYRAYTDSIGTYFMHDGKRIKITAAELIRGEFRILRVTPEGKREISFADFARN